MRDPPADEPALLRAATPAAWLECATGAQAVLLIDHANCEKKAASTALALMFAYAEDPALTLPLSRLAREELRHHEQVVKLIGRLGIALERLAPGRYAERLRRAVARREPERAVDLLLCGAFIEARSCERFAALVRAMPRPIGELFESLQAAEARHQGLYLALARRRAAAAGLELAPRIEAFGALEAELITTPDPLFRFHSGVPA